MLRKTWHWNEYPEGGLEAGRPGGAEYGEAHGDATLKNQQGRGRIWPAGPNAFYPSTRRLAEGKKAWDGAQVTLQGPV